jgi:tRNA (guanine37-N1)-methyltransferase
MKRGGTIHMHKIMERSSSDETIKELIGEMKAKGHKIRIERKTELKTYSPTMSVYVIDIVKE